MPRHRPLLLLYASLLVMDFCVTLQIERVLQQRQDKLPVTFVS
jgi:hypothetical protein